MYVAGSLVRRLAALTICFVVTTATATVAPPDIGVYGEQSPFFRDGTTPFPSSGGIFEDQQDGDDPITRLEFNAISGMKNTLGSFAMRHATFGKYVIVGNGKTTSAGGSVVDQRIGVYDSEAKQFCSLLVHASTNASDRSVQTANPTGRKSRILFAGDAPTGGPVFGYILADLDAANPCTSWQSFTVTTADLNAGFPVGQQPCPGDLCDYDGMALIAHEDGGGDYGVDYVSLASYYSPVVAVVRVNASGASVVGTYKMGQWFLPDSGGACYTNSAARLAASDFRVPDTRPSNDKRILYSFDSFPVEVYDATTPPECADPYLSCPLDVAGDGLSGAPCPQSGQCANAYCTKPVAGFGVTTYNACNPNNDTCGAAGPCRTACAEKSPLYTCTTSGRQCFTTFANPAYCPSGQTCQRPPLSGPSQEFRFAITGLCAGGSNANQPCHGDADCPGGTCNGENTLTPTSPPFLATPQPGGGASPMAYFYDEARGLWAPHDDLLGELRTIRSQVFYPKNATDNCIVDDETMHHVPTGEHCYYDPTNVTRAIVVGPDQILDFDYENGPWDFDAVSANSQTASGTIYFTGRSSIQRAQLGVFGWTMTDDSAYKVAIGHDLLPANPRRCSGRSCMSNADCDPNFFGNPTLGPCQSGKCSLSFFACNPENGNADCTPKNVGMCQTLAESAVPMADTAKTALVTGGAPASLWAVAGFISGPPVAQTNFFFLRTPVAMNLPDNISAVRPSIGWSGDRLWMVAEHGGVLQYRIRDDGQWSGWYPLANTVTTVGGPAVVASSTGVQVFVRSTSGQVLQASLAAPITCKAAPAGQPGACAWFPWGSLPALPGGLTTSTDVAATFTPGSPNPVAVVAVRASNNGIYATRVGSGSWTKIGILMATDLAPAVTYHPTDGKVWIVARLAGTQSISYTRFDPNTLVWESWGGTSSTGQPAAWVAGPALVSDGTAVRVFGTDQTFPNSTYQAANDGSGWTAWRPLVSGSGATRQATVTNINGDLDLVTYWFTNGMQETFIP